MKTMEYVGKIRELRGQIAMVRPAWPLDFPLHDVRLSGIVMAQFHVRMKYNEQPMHLGWHPFSIRDFLEIKNGKQVF
jgi:hypothetical protein